MKTATIVQGDDWVGVYVEGKLITEGHSVNAYELLNQLGYYVDSVEPDFDWLWDIGNLPVYLKDVKENK